MVTSIYRLINPWLNNRADIRSKVFNRKSEAIFAFLTDGQRLSTRNYIFNVFVLLLYGNSKLYKFYLANQAFVFIVNNREDVGAGHQTAYICLPILLTDGCLFYV